MSLTSVLERAWSWREKEGILAKLPAVRVFHGPGEGDGESRELAIERFGQDYWVTAWGKLPENARLECAKFLESREAGSAVWIERPEKGLPETSRQLLGRSPDQVWAREGSARFQIRFLGTRHPGLFLDHEPLRRWLSRGAKGARVLNTFAYTGSLSVASALGGASHVTTLDLSRPSLAWAKENWEGNGLATADAEFVSGDVFEWLPRWKRSGRRFDCVILDPPSFSRGRGGTFSTSKDLGRLHELAFQLVEPGGLLVSSINSSGVTRAKFQAELSRAAKASGLKLELLEPIGLPPTFPVSREGDRYLKGGIYRCS
jgi:23S rRNA G2069 N7-methylase RlmK/C1962 C5-methylase RlmI